MLRLRAHLLFHFKKHKKLEKNWRKSCIWRWSWWSSWRFNKGCTFESQLGLFMRHSYLIEHRTNKIVDFFKLGSIDKTRMWLRGRGRGRSDQKRNLLFYWRHFFSLSAYKVDLESKNIVLFQRKYFMDGTSAKIARQTFCY